MRRLNAWQRLGIVLSIIWIVGAGLWQRNIDVNRAQVMMDSQYQPCSEAAFRLSSNADAANDKCMAEALKLHEIMLEGSWANTATFAFGSTALAWLAAYIALWTTRWVLAGRKA